MPNKFFFYDCYSSRHPKIQYWFWDKELVETKTYLRQLDVLVENSDFNTVMITERDGLNFYDKELLAQFAEVVSYAHAKGLKIYLQLWTNGQTNPVKVNKKDAVAYVSEREGVLIDGRLSLTHSCTHVRNLNFNPHIENCLVGAYAFKKLKNGVYEPNTLIDITAKAVVESEKDVCSLSFNLPDLEGYTVYAMVAHYYSYADLFGERMISDFCDAMDFYRSAGFDGFVLDEMKNVPVVPSWLNSTPCERCYGDHFKSYFYEQTGEDLDKILFEMRYCANGYDKSRIKAINLYFDIFRHSTKRVEKLVAEYNTKHFGSDAFFGLHNTYHNSLQSDEMYTTGCNWWEVPRKYGQTDEDITFPVRMVIACQTTENLCIDMFYNKSEDAFVEKAMRDAPFGCRTHYHAMNDSFYGVNTGTEEFLSLIRPYERKISLLNAFDPPALPKMELLVVFGFPALCNWYPDEQNKTDYDLNGALNIEKRVDGLWKAGYFNALAPSDAIDDGRIVLDANGLFDYCGHKFEKMLYLYPQYAKASTINKLKSFISENAFVRIIGGIDRDFSGNTVDNKLFESVTVEETSDIPSCLCLSPNPITNGCVLADGTVIVSSLDSIKNDESEVIALEVNGHVFEVEFKGVFAIKADGSGKISRLACGDCKSLKRDGKELFAFDIARDILISEKYKTREGSMS